MEENKEGLKSRRSFLRGVAQQAINIAAGVIAGSTVGGGIMIGAETAEQLLRTNRPLDLPDPIKPKPSPTPDPARAVEPVASELTAVAAKAAVAIAEQPAPVQVEKIDPISRLSRVATAVLNTPERAKAENEFLTYVFSKKNLTAADIDQGLWVITNPRIRQSLLGLRYNLRHEKADPKLKLLSKDKEEWAKKQGISPETLAITTDAYPRAKRILEALLKHNKSQFRPDIEYREKVGLLPKGTFANLTADQMMINPGGMAKLIITETGGVTYVLGNGKDVAKDQVIHEGFTTIGNHSAWAETNINFFPTGHISLKDLRNMLQTNTKVDYQTKNIPGSARGDDKINASGGAVGIQIMPDNVMEILGILNNPELQLDERDRWLNVFDLDDATVMAWIFLARGVKVGKEPDAFRTGYLRGPRDQKSPQATKDYFAKLRNWAIEKWNPYKPQRDAIMKAANSYSDQYPS